MSIFISHQEARQLSRGAFFTSDQFISAFNTAIDRLPENSWKDQLKQHSEFSIHDTICRFKLPNTGWCYRRITGNDVNNIVKTITQPYLGCINEVVFEDANLADLILSKWTNIKASANVYSYRLKDLIAKYHIEDILKVPENNGIVRLVFYCNITTTSSNTLDNIQPFESGFHWLMLKFNPETKPVFDLLKFVSQIVFTEDPSSVSEEYKYGLRKRPNNSHCCVHPDILKCSHSDKFILKLRQYLINPNSAVSMISMSNPPLRKLLEQLYPEITQ